MGVSELSASVPK